jgi:allophanate hydrolase subunit 1
VVVRHNQTALNACGVESVQVPSILVPGITIVISPLLSLIQDQVMALLNGHVPIPTLYLTSDLPDSVAMSTYRELHKPYPSCHMLYVTPERVQASGVWDIMGKLYASVGAPPRSSATPRHATPRHATPRHATPRHATPRHATPRHASPRHATPRHATPRHATPRHATPRHATPRHATIAIANLQLGLA